MKPLQHLSSFSNKMQSPRDCLDEINRYMELARKNKENKYYPGARDCVREAQSLWTDELGIEYPDFTRHEWHEVDAANCNLAWNHTEKEITKTEFDCPVCDEPVHVGEAHYQHKCRNPYCTSCLEEWTKTS